jgi:hypothetical protein
MRRAAAALLLAAGASSAAACALDLLDPAGGARLARVALPADRAFALAYTHSVSLRPVESRYVVRGGGIVQVAEVFDEHGPGMSTEPAPGERLQRHTDENGSRFVLHMARPIGRLVVRLHERPAFRLTTADQAIALDRWHTRSVELRPDCLERREDRK